MIGKLKGRVDEVLSEGVLLDVAGVGYWVRLPHRTLATLGSPGSPVTLYIYTHVREEALDLYGFVSHREQEIFKTLLGVSGVGPRLAVAILDALGVSELQRALNMGDATALTRVSGVGRKTAERLILELQDKFGDWVPEGTGVAPVANDALSEAVAALEALGYAGGECARVLQELGRQDPERVASWDAQAWVREGLKRLSREGGKV